MVEMKVSEGGRVVIPAEFRRLLGIRDGDVVYWAAADGKLTLTSRSDRIRRAQILIARHCNPAVGGSVVDELLAERRAEGAVT
jgi:AbrB family looped-hinge helix DNA binding protein